MSLPESFPVELLAPPDPTRLPLPPAAPGLRLVRGAVYDVPEGCRPLEMDPWLPTETPEPTPVIVFVHGGAWRTGLRDDLGPASGTGGPAPSPGWSAPGSPSPAPPTGSAARSPTPANSTTSARR